MERVGNKIGMSLNDLMVEKGRWREAGDRHVQKKKKVIKKKIGHFGKSNNIDFHRFFVRFLFVAVHCSVRAVSRKIEISRERKEVRDQSG